MDYADKVTELTKKLATLKKKGDLYKNWKLNIKAWTVNGFGEREIFQGSKAKDEVITKLMIASAPKNKSNDLNHVYVDLWLNEDRIKQIKEILISYIAQDERKLKKDILETLKELQTEMEASLI